MEINKTYIIRVLLGGRFLTYVGKIISNKDGFVTFLDNRGKILNIAMSQVQSFEESGQ